MAKQKDNGKPAPKEAPKKAPAKGKGTKSNFWSLVKSLILALVLAFLVRVFIFEIFKIPSCSMEPTLEGIDLSTGDRVGVNKLAYVFGDVQRYDVVVFEGTAQVEGKTINRDYIKRVCGLPGEELAIVAGDLYANGEIAPKPLKVQNSVWIPVHDETFSNDSWKRFWKTDGDWSPMNGALRGNGGKLRYVHWEQVRRGDKLESAFITNLYPRLPVLKEVVGPNARERFQPKYSDCYVIEDRENGILERGFISPATGEKIIYEGRRDDKTQPLRGEMEVDFWLGGKSIVPDLYIELDVTPLVRTGTLSITLGRGNDRATDSDPHTLELAIGPGNPPLYRTRDASKPLPEESRLLPDTKAHIVFAIWDGQVYAEIDGKPILQTSFTLTRREANGNFLTIELGDKTVAELDNISIKRDIFYIPVDAGKMNPHQISPGKYKVPEGRFFMMGDNSPASSDCRLNMQPVLRENIVGRAFFLLWPPRNWKRMPSGG